MDEKRQNSSDKRNENFAEKRQTDRKKLIVDVHFEGGDATGIANTENISLGGLFMNTNTSFEIGTPLLMRLTFGGRGVVIRGVVAYIEDHGVGVNFEELSADTEEILIKELQAV